MTRPDAEVWLVDLEACAGALDAAGAGLTDGDRARIATTADPEARRERALAHIALRLLIARLFGSRWHGVSYRIAERGKLTLPGLPGDFTLAHTAGLALIGATREGEIGADLETLRAVRISDVRRAEIISVAASLAPGSALPEDAGARVLQAWVRLEAVAKADGRGVGQALTALGARGTAWAGTDDASLAGRFRVTDLDAGRGVFAAVATRAGSLEPCFGRLSACRQDLALWAATPGSGRGQGSSV